MSFPGNILDRVSHLFDDGIDDILIYALVFLFIFLSGQQRDDKCQDEPAESESGFPIILIVIFLFIFLFSGFRNESDEKI
jgi:hypothetical protein